MHFWLAAIIVLGFKCPILNSNLERILCFIYLLLLFLSFPTNAKVHIFWEDHQKNHFEFDRLDLSPTFELFSLKFHFFWEGHKHLHTLPHGFDVLVFSEKLNFKEYSQKELMKTYQHVPISNWSENSSLSNSKVCDFLNFCGFSRIYELYVASTQVPFRWKLF